MVHHGRVWFAGATLLGTLALSACGGPQVPLTGVVKDAYTGQPVAAATIKLGSTELTTDASGRYQASTWSTKDTLTVNAGGYEAATVALESQPQLAKPEMPAATLDTTIRPNTLTGTATDAYTGKPLPGVTVRVGETSATTDASGRYTLNNLPESFTVAASMADYAEASQDLNRTTSLDLVLRPSVLTGVVTDRFTSKPLADATVDVNGVSVKTGADGRYRLENLPEGGDVTISADGYAKLSEPLGKRNAFDAVLRPDQIKGTLLDAKTNKPIKFATIIAGESLEKSATTSTRIDNSTDGAFTLGGIPETGFVQVLAPGYKKSVVELKPGAGLGEVKLEPFQSKALYVTAPLAMRPKAWQSYLDAADKTEINSLVIDLKSDLWGDLGLVYYDSQAPMVKELKTSAPNMDLPKIIADAKARGIYTIARIHIFSHDNVLAAAKPEWAGRDLEGNVLASRPTKDIHYDWLDPWNKNVWEYNIQIAEEAALMGFDEINFDYIRFPDIDPKKYKFSQPTDPINNPDAMYANIAEFAKVSQERINNAGAFFSVDVFGYAAVRPMWEIGQNISVMAPYTDYIMPMVYPSHYFPTEFGFDVPAEHPYEIVSESMKIGWKLVDGKRGLLRPWLQDFTLVWQTPVVKYGPTEVRAQIKATEEFPQHAGWAMWDPDGFYDEEAFLPE